MAECRGLGRDELSRVALGRASLVALSLVAIAPGCGGATSRPVADIHDPLIDTTPQQLFDAGVTAANEGDYIRSEQYFAAAQEHGFPSEQVIGPLMSVCVRSSRMSAALSYAEPYLERHPADWRLRQLVATIDMGLGDREGALRQLQHVVRDVPDEAVPHYMLAILARDELHDEALMRGEFARYLELAPDGSHADEASEGLAVAATLPPTAVPVRLSPADVSADAPAPDAPPLPSSAGASP